MDTASTDTPLSGDIKYFRLPEVLQLLSMQRLTGALTLTGAGRKVYIYVKEGQVAFISGDRRGSREQLGSMLVGMGRLKKSEVESALARAERTGKMLGEVLSEGGLASTDDIRAALRKQTERSVYKAVAWGEGRFDFTLGPMPGYVDEMPAGLKVEDLLVEGAGRIGEWRKINEKIPGLDVVFVRSGNPEGGPDAGNLGETARLVLSLVDGRRDVASLIEACGASEFAVMKALYALYLSGAIKKRGPLGRTYRTDYL